MLTNAINFSASTTILGCVIGLALAMISKNEEKTIDFYFMKSVPYAGGGAILGFLLGIIEYISY